MTKRQERRRQKPWQRPSDATPRYRWGRRLKMFWRRRKDGTRGQFLGYRKHCGKHGTRFKHLRYRARLWNETTNEVQSIKAKAYACPICLRVA